ncbi:hypothetical protein [Polymorphobacter fuscus]|uniref:ASCH domain-containing protein n=2 Tax=Sandarakinorhabdus fusca TaxID=1439888 RepID=A0A7C9GQ27_9SPHN|nr:hypothetical protein [Polymorphobacter fuscus]KAB7646099.1 hypothetical protein F9290_08465 [Polymorphobacter fuscus]MQT17296.1 hypothetical protein [Polymorphobacter fuscus]NJC10172.1 hypothetical protein [Polymorphobacter fuscus]
MALKGLIIRQPWIEMILAGTKTWEMRSERTALRGPIALIEKGTGLVVGTAILSDSLPPLSPEDMGACRTNHGIPAEMSGEVGFKWFTPWVLTEARRLAQPVPYVHRSGAVIWVELDADVEMAVGSQSQMDPGPAPPIAKGPPAAVAGPLPTPGVSTGIVGVHIPLTGGNIRNGHFYLRVARSLLPVNAIGGSNKSAAGWPVTVNFASGETVETDVDGEKMIFRERAAVRRFFERVKPREGDRLLLERTAERHFRVSLAA